MVFGNGLSPAIKKRYEDRDPQPTAEECFKLAVRLDRKSALSESGSQGNVSGGRAIRRSSGYGRNSRDSPTSSVVKKEGDSNRSSQPEADARKCYSCGKIGHISRYCSGNVRGQRK